MFWAARAAHSALNAPSSAARKRTERLRLLRSLRSMSMMTTCPAPSRARFLITSLPSAPAPPPRTRAWRRPDCFPARPRAQREAGHVNEDDRAGAEQGEVVNHFSAERAGADDEDAGLAQQRLFP